MLKALKCKLKNNKGFTLTEMLCATVVMVLVSGCLTVGINLCNSSLKTTNTYSKMQMLSTTLVNTISDELRYAKDPTSGDSFTYVSEKHGKNARIFSNTSGQVVLTSDVDTTEFPLVASSAYFGSKVTFNKMQYNESNKTFSVKFTITTDNGMNRETSFEVKSLNATT